MAGSAFTGVTSYTSYDMNGYYSRLLLCFVISLKWPTLGSTALQLGRRKITTHLVAASSYWYGLCNHKRQRSSTYIGHIKSHKLDHKS